MTRANLNFTRGAYDVSLCASTMRLPTPQQAVLCKTEFNRWEDVDAVPDVVHCLTNIRSTFTAIRNCLKRIGELCGAAIEPDSQTELIEATLKVPGVLIAGVPGAGGFDAVFAVVLSDAVRADVEKLWLGYPSQVVPLVLEEDPYGILLHGPATNA